MRVKVLFLSFVRLSQFKEKQSLTKRRFREIGNLDFCSSLETKFRYFQFYKMFLLIKTKIQYDKVTSKIQNMKFIQIFSIF